MNTLSFFKCVALISGVYLLSVPSHAQQAPPSLGEETKGIPAISETAPNVKSVDNINNHTAASLNDQETSNPTAIDTLLGSAIITESKRENGQVYRIELEHSSGSKQFIEETDSDGKIGSTSNDIEETPNLPKWKIGSW